MLKILGSRKQFCDGITRRDWLQIGGLSTLGLGVGELFKHAARGATPTASRGFGKAKACILLFLYGSPSQLETFDCKPEAPEDIRGELGVIPSSLPGMQVCELLPHTAKVMDRVTVVRSLTHPYPLHGVAFAATAVPSIDVAMELNPRDTRHWPFIGSVVDYVEDQKGPTVSPEIPRNIALPFPFSSQRRGEVPRAGPYAAFLGSAYNPVWTTFEGKGTRAIPKTLAGETIQVHDPYVGIEPTGRFLLSESGSLPADMSLDRLDRRRSLLAQMDDARRQWDQSDAGLSYDRFHSMAMNMLTSTRLREALDIARESPAVRESYGMTLFGQSALAARRLVEAGSRLVTVFWDEYGLAGSGWDTHWQHYPRMKDELLPPFDRGFAGLILDLEARGMLDDTLVVCISEHGRTPKITKGQGGGRDHWSRAYSAVFAGGGIAKGNIVGRTDRIAGDVQDTPVSPKDIHATIYHLLGIDPETLITDRLGRPLPIAGDGRVRMEMLS
ncbi:MAG: DUF1501 domain-containing protein [Planctomycetota bacterium]